MMRSNLAAAAHSAAPRRHNVPAVFVLFAAAGILHANFDPAPVGASRHLPAPARHLSSVAISQSAFARLPGSCPGRTSDHAETPPLVRTALADPPASSGVISGEHALLLNVLLLEKGAHDLARVPDYTATFSKQEAVDGILRDAEVIFLKLRHEPFSIYFKWIQGDVGREVLYVDGQNDGNMIVRLGGLKGRLLPAVKIDPLGERALAECRHPITDAGLLRLAERLANDRRRDLGRNGVRCRMDDDFLDDRPCYRFTVEIDSPAIDESHRKSVQFIDKELSLPVCLKFYGWPDASSNGVADLDEATLIECYRYTDIRLNQQLAESDFDRSNREYRFRR